MHGWEGRPFADIDRLTRKRDPRRHPIGCVTTDGEREIVQWFGNIPELSQFLRRMEPQRWGLAGAALIEIKAQLEAVLTRVDVFGLTEDNRLAHNRLTAPRYEVVWWGSLQELLRDPGEWPSQLRAAAGADDADDPAVRIAEHLRERLRQH
ncbi:hypothetical protein [Sediminicurvatus halobius]|uniref:Uncharacterized protein n=1 Tax=Sediminicurvatus halobius TaxID=2182432 RepID=A0A2U2MW24_9GAMM|nr:hypothetical protein [Spiribacter halobius]PWG61053.1 hypothetical protein DEM34_18400 [Spiribacter halobius]UEX76775.1 hypothetical protein LMH63_12505 [Spiribacter halobius]